MRAHTRASPPLGRADSFLACPNQVGGVRLHHNHGATEMASMIGPLFFIDDDFDDEESPDVAIGSYPAEATPTGRQAALRLTE